ncbi:MAG: hypothetical protein IPJ06_02190 [Saprospiraceae bacterium]|nr:hypothetical protein [Saprospiraceae bacterium]
MTWPLINLSVDATSYTWEIDGVGTFNGPSPVVSFNQPGIYGIRLIARQTDACQDTLDLQDILQVFQGPQAAFSVDVNDDEHIIGDVLLPIFLNGVTGICGIWATGPRIHPRMLFMNMISTEPSVCC